MAAKGSVLRVLAASLAINNANIPALSLIGSTTRAAIEKAVKAAVEAGGPDITVESFARGAEGEPSVLEAPQLAMVGSRRASRPGGGPGVLDEGPLSDLTIELTPTHLPVTTIRSNLVSGFS